MATSRPTVGLCGCGNMGGAIAARLSTGSDLAVYDIVAERSRAVAERHGASSADSVAELAQRSEAIVLSLPNAAASLEVTGELVEHAGADLMLIECSTIGVSDVESLAMLCSLSSIRLIEAAILSGVAQMADGSSMLLIGGTEEDVRAAAPVLDLLAHRQLHLGPLGAGMTAKIANNAVSHAVMVVLLEAAAMAGAAGVSLDRLGEILTQQDGGLTRPLHHRLLERVKSGDFEGGMSTDAALKDSRLALGLAQEVGVPLFAIQAAHTPYELAVAGGLGRRDYAALALLWEGWTGRALGPERRRA